MHSYSLKTLSPGVQWGPGPGLAAIVAIWVISVSCLLARTRGFVDGDIFSEIVQDMLMFPLMPCDASSWPCVQAPLEFQLPLICDCCPKEGVLGIPDVVPPLLRLSFCLYHSLGEGIMSLYSFTHVPVPSPYSKVIVFLHHHLRCQF